jgi:hypothetical protein
MAIFRLTYMFSFICRCFWCDSHYSVCSAASRCVILLFVDNPFSILHTFVVFIEQHVSTEMAIFRLTYMLHFNFVHSLTVYLILIGRTFHDIERNDWLRSQSRFYSEYWWHYFSTGVVTVSGESWSSSQVVQKCNIIKYPQQSHHNMSLLCKK